MAAEPPPTATPRMPPIQPHIRSRLLLRPSPTPTGASPSGATLGLAGRVDRLEGVADEALRTPERAGHIEATVEAPQIFRGLDGLLERGLGEAERRPESLEFAGIDLTLIHRWPPDTG